MTSWGQKGRKVTSLAKSGAVLMIYGQFLCIFWQFFAIFFAIFGMYTCCPSGKPFPPMRQPYWATSRRQHPLGSVFVGLGAQKRSLAAGASAVPPVFSWFSPSPPLTSLFAFVLLSSPFSSEHPCDPTSCNFPPLVQSPPLGAVFWWASGCGAPDAPSKTRSIPYVTRPPG